jgi:hypothetical protein
MQTSLVSQTIVYTQEHVQPKRRRRRAMAPISVQVPEEHKLLLRALAVAKNTSMSVLMREALDEYITRSSLYFVKSP